MTAFGPVVAGDDSTPGVDPLPPVTAGSFRKSGLTERLATAPHPQQILRFKTTRRYNRTAEYVITS
jgi:hypothetical protein